MESNRPHPAMSQNYASSLMILLSQLVSLLPLLLILVGCILFVVRTPGFASWTMLTGNLITLFLGVANAVLVVLFTRQVMEHETFTQAMTFTRVAMTLGSLLFGGGLILLALQSRRSSPSAVSPPSSATPPTSESP